MRNCEACFGKVIARMELLALGDDGLRITFTDKTTLEISDAGQSCCETRYMRTDDDMAMHIGATLTGVQVKEAADVNPCHGDLHEVVFMEVLTSNGHVTFSNHNEHNGYYGGFLLSAKTGVVEEETHGA